MEETKTLNIENWNKLIGVQLDNGWLVKNAYMIYEPKSNYYSLEMKRLNNTLGSKRLRINRKGNPILIDNQWMWKIEFGSSIKIESDWVFSKDLESIDKFVKYLNVLIYERGW